MKKNRVVPVALVVVIAISAITIEHTEGCHAANRSGSSAH